MFKNRYGLIIIIALLLFSCGEEDVKLRELGREFFYGSEEYPGGIAISSWKDSSRFRMIYFEKSELDLDDDWEYLFDELGSSVVALYDNVYEYRVHFVHKPTDNILRVERTYYYDTEEWNPVLLKYEKYLIDGATHKVNMLERSTVWDGDFDE